MLQAGSWILEIDPSQLMSEWFEFFDKEVYFVDKTLRKLVILLQSKENIPRIEVLIGLNIILFDDFRDIIS